METSRAWLQEVCLFDEQVGGRVYLATQQRKHAAEKRFQAVILSEALDRTVQGEAKNLGSCGIMQL
jgi:hypothetical protein